MTYGININNGHWGRSIHPSWSDKLVVLTLITVCPFLGLFMVMTNTNYDGSILNSLYALVTGDFFKNIPSYSSYLATILGFFIIFEYLLALVPDYFSEFLPSYKGGKQYGQKTPANHLLEYNINGLQAWVITNALFLILCYFNIIDIEICFGSINYSFGWIRRTFCAILILRSMLWLSFRHYG